MADKVNFKVSFAPFANWAPYAGSGGSDIVPFDGLVEVKLASFEPYFTEAKPNSPSKPAIKVFSTIVDKDGENLRLIDDVLCGGKDKHGEDMGRQLMELLASSGTTVEAIQQLAKEGKDTDIAALCQQIVGRSAYCEIQASAYNGKEGTEVTNWIMKERYEQAKTLGAHRRKRRAVTTGTTTNLGGTNGATAPTGSSSLPML